MKQAVSLPVSIKCRVGLNTLEPSYESFRDFIFRAIEVGGVTDFVVHSRTAMLNMKPDKNRKAPPLCPEFVHRLRQAITESGIEASLPESRVSIIFNGEIKTPADALYRASGSGVSDYHSQYHYARTSHPLVDHLNEPHSLSPETESMVHLMTCHPSSSTSSSSFPSPSSSNTLRPPLDGVMVGRASQSLITFPALYDALDNGLCYHNPTNPFNLSQFIPSPSPFLALRLSPQVASPTPSASSTGHVSTPPNSSSTRLPHSLNQFDPTFRYSSIPSMPTNFSRYQLLSAYIDLIEQVVNEAKDYVDTVTQNIVTSAVNDSRARNLPTTPTPNKMNIQKKANSNSNTSSNNNKSKGRSNNTSGKHFNLGSTRQPSSSYSTVSSTSSSSTPSNLNEFSLSIEHPQEKGIYRGWRTKLVSAVPDGLILPQDINTMNQNPKKKTAGRTNDDSDIHTTNHDSSSSNVDTCHASSAPASHTRPKRVASDFTFTRPDLGFAIQSATEILRPLLTLFSHTPANKLWMATIHTLITIQSRKKLSRGAPEIEFAVEGVYSTWHAVRNLRNLLEDPMSVLKQHESVFRGYTSKDSTNSGQTHQGDNGHNGGTHHGEEGGNGSTHERRSLEWYAEVLHRVMHEPIITHETQHRLAEGVRGYYPDIAKKSNNDVNDMNQSPLKEHHDVNKKLVRQAESY